MARRTGLVAAIALCSLLPACSGSEPAVLTGTTPVATLPDSPPVASRPTTATAAPGSSVPAPTAPSTTVVGTAPAPTAELPSTTVIPSTVAATTQPVPPVAATDPPVVGAAGGTGDAFCVQYGVLATSAYLIGLSEAYASDPLAPRVVELAAASTVVDAYDGAVAALPPVAGADAPAFTARWRPYRDRAAAGLSITGNRPELAAAWQLVLATHDRNDPDVRLPVDATDLTALRAPAAQFDGAVGPLTADRALAAGAGASMPDVDAYVGDACPDVAALTIADAV